LFTRKNPLIFGGKRNQAQKRRVVTDRGRLSQKTDTNQDSACCRGREKKCLLRPRGGKRVGGGGGGGAGGGVRVAGGGEDTDKMTVVGALRSLTPIKKGGCKIRCAAKRGGGGKESRWDLWEGTGKVRGRAFRVFRLKRKAGGRRGCGSKWGVRL